MSCLSIDDKIYIYIYIYIYIMELEENLSMVKLCQYKFMLTQRVSFLPATLYTLCKRVLLYKSERNIQ